MLLKRFYYNKYVKNNYDVEVAFLEGPITRLFSVKNKEVKKIAWIHNDISKVYGNDLKAKMKLTLDKKIYNKYGKLIFVSKDNKKSFEETYKDIKPSKEVIYNYIDINKVIEKSKQEIDFKFDNNQLNFLTVARLVEQKGIDRLIKIHKQLLENNYKNKFYVIGDGPEREKLKGLIEKENLSDTFILLGKKENPYPYMKQSDIFCLLSKFEGYGMVLEEAKILNKPIIITNTAAREALQNYKNAKIIDNNEKAIYNNLRDIIKKDIRNFENSENKYNNEDIIQKLKKLLEEK